MRITVREPFSVAHDGVAYPPGSSVEVPDEVGAEWVRSDWADDTTIADTPGVKP